MSDRAVEPALIGLVVGAALLGWGAPALGDGWIVATYGVLFVPYLYSLFVLGSDRPPDGADEPAGRQVGRRLTWIVAAAVLARLALLASTPVLSDDIFRYVWDGRVGLSGINPFEHPPAADVLAPLRDPAIWENVNHPDVATIYPPGAQYLFHLNAWLAGSVTGLKTLFVALEAGCVVGAWTVARGAGISRRAREFGLAVYVLNPLVFVETAWSGHLDVVAWSLLAVGLLVWVVRRSFGSALLAGGLIGASVAVKFLGLVAVPFLLWPGQSPRDADTSGTGEPSSRPWRHRLAAVALIPLLVGCSYLPYLQAGSDLFSGFGTYAAKWKSNDGGFRATSELADYTLRAWTTDKRPERASVDDSEILYRFTRWNDTFERLGITEQWQGRTIPATTFTAGQLAALVAKAIAVLLVMLALSWALFTRAGPVAGTSLLLVVLYLFAPVVHPWYVAWLVPLCALRPNRTALTFSAVVLVAYFAWWSARTGGDWFVPHWLVAVEYGAVLLAAAFDVADPFRHPPD